jgi:hypothetical protein
MSRSSGDVTGSVSPSTSTLTVRRSASQASTGGNLGSLEQALTALAMISSARLSFVAWMVPMQPRSRPSSFRDTKAPARVP